MPDITLSDYIAICETKARYCRALDTKDWAEYADVFTEDLLLDTEPAGGYKVQGRDEALRLVRRSVEHAKTAHQVHSPEIKFLGDSADVTWAMQDRVIYGPDRAHLPYAGHTGFGHYHERYVRHAGRWRIAKTTLTRLHMDNYPHTPKS